MAEEWTIFYSSKIHRFDGERISLLLLYERWERSGFEEIAAPKESGTSITMSYLGAYDRT